MYDWPDEVRQKVSCGILQYLAELRERYNKYIKQSANKYLYVFNVRHLYRIVHSLACLESEVQMKESEIALLLLSDTYRTLIDRVGEKDDRRILSMEVQAMVSAHF